MKILFVTGNKRKIGEALLACEPFGIEIQQVILDIDEIQSREPLKIAHHKAEQAFNLVGKPLVVADSSWNIPALNGFPGGYMKDMNEWFSSKDFLALMASKTDRRISFSETIIYKDKQTTKVFSKEFWGKIASAPRGKGNAIEKIAEFEGFTIGERKVQGRFSHEPEEYIWHEFAQWFSSYKA